MEAADEVFEFGVLPLKLLEVIDKARLHNFIPEDFIYLL